MWLLLVIYPKACWNLHSLNFDPATVLVNFPTTHPHTQSKQNSRAHHTTADHSLKDYTYTPQHVRPLLSSSITFVERIRLAEEYFLPTAAQQLRNGNYCECVGNTLFTDVP